jgi:TM2 domain-containing membrane protein YozV
VQVGPPPAYPTPTATSLPVQPDYGGANPGAPGAPGYAGQMQPGYAMRPDGMVVAPKNPAVSLLASFFIPGLGSMLNGDVSKGVVILVCYLISAVLTLVIIGIFGLFGFWIFGMVDAYNGARAWNARHGIYS